MERVSFLLIPSCFLLALPTGPVQQPGRLHLCAQAGQWHSRLSPCTIPGTNKRAPIVSYMATGLSPNSSGARTATVAHHFNPSYYSRPPEPHLSHLPLPPPRDSTAVVLMLVRRPSVAYQGHAAPVGALLSITLMLSSAHTGQRPARLDFLHDT